MRLALRRTRVRAAVLALLFAAGTAVGCFAGRTDGFYYTLKQGETVYRVGKRYGVPIDVLVRQNAIRDVRDVSTGARLWIPKRRPPRRNIQHARAQATKQRAQASAQRAGQLTFRWPVRGRLSSRFGRRNGRPHQGIDVAARKGTPIYSSEAGRVIHAGRLGAYGNVVIVKHPGHYRTVYAHANRVHVSRGDFVDRGEVIAEVGATGRATGPHLHFEVRRGETPRDPMMYLP